MSTAGGATKSVDGATGAFADLPAFPPHAASTTDTAPRRIARIREGYAPARDSALSVAGREAQRLARSARRGGESRGDGRERGGNSAWNARCTAADRMR